ncbi:hypothetical protein BrevBR_05790 [Brevundimonas sp. BR2-1]|uniref:hypothetical protein n=1 Tax=Brevundimonas sp. BR2-1 TaxID=3031123 RepID=UPI0030A8D888
MRVLILAPALLLLAAAGCASTATTNSYNDELQRLSEDCAARGGILSPTGQQSGRPNTDNVCKITGGASRLPQGG